MKIAFVDSSRLAYDATTPFDRPLGGTQSAVCYLAAALARRGHETCIFNAIESEHRALDVRTSPALTPDAYRRYNDFDAIVVPTVLNGKALRAAGVTAPMISWQHQSHSSSNTRPIKDAAEHAAWDRIVFVSDHQRLQFRRTFGVEGMVLRNAPSPAFASLEPRSRYFFEDGTAPHFVYCSAPGRGLDFLLVAFPTIRTVLPQATLAVYSDQKLYQVDAERDDYSVYYELAKALPGVRHFGSVPQPELARAMAAADFWLYPTTFVETSCIAMMEAGCAGLGLVTSDFGALPETSASHATILKPSATRSAWSRQFARAVIERVREARADPSATRSRLEAQIRHFKAASWDDRAAEWIAMLTPLVLQPRRPEPA